MTHTFQVVFNDLTSNFTTKNDERETRQHADLPRESPTTKRKRRQQKCGECSSQNKVSALLPVINSNKEGKYPKAT